MQHSLFMARYRQGQVKHWLNLAEEETDGDEGGTIRSSI